MSRTLSLPTHLLTTGTHLLTIGRPVEARERLEAVLRFADATPDAKADAHRKLGRLHADARSERPARRHLRAALQIEPTCPVAARELAASLSRDGRHAAASRMYRRLLTLDRADAAAWAGYGRSAIALGDTAAGLRRLRRAVRLAPADASILADLVDALTAQGSLAVARRVVAAARFRLPRHARVEAMERDLRFRLAARAQARRRDRLSGGPVILAFPTATATVPGLRLDAGHAPARPHLHRLRTVRRDPNRLA